MDRTTGRYDAALQMFTREPREIDLAHLRFLRWLGERGRLEHGPSGPPSGPELFRAMADARLCAGRDLAA